MRQPAFLSRIVFFFFFRLCPVRRSHAFPARHASSARHAPIDSTSRVLTHPPRPIHATQPTGEAAAGGTSASDPRVARAAELRRALSPPELLKEDGSIHQAFFKPERVR